MIRKILPAPRRPTIPMWEIKRAVRAAASKVLHNPANSKRAKTAASLGLTSRRRAS